MQLTIDAKECFNLIQNPSLSHGIWEGCSKKSNVTFKLHECDTSEFFAQGYKIFVLEIEGASQDFNPKNISIGPFSLPDGIQKVLANGWQCWSESPLLGKNEILPRESYDDRKPFGDDAYIPYAQKPGLFHAWSFSFATHSCKSHSWFGALDEDIVSTAFCFDLNKQQLRVFMETDESFSAQYKYSQFLSELIGQSELKGKIVGAFLLPLKPQPTDLQTLCSGWFSLVRKCERVQRCIKETNSKTLEGYTSWYYDYNNISEVGLKKQLQDISAHMPNWKVFQIDDGYQKHIGDWLDYSPHFPNGVTSLAQEAKKHGKIPGIWIAPFIVSKHSNTFRNHPEWLLRNSHGDLVLCGNHPLWGGEFYALDSENTEVLNHLQAVFKTFFEVWGFQFLKADFLYSNAMIATPGMSRALRSARAHEFLARSCLISNAQFLSCGSLLSASFGRCHYARIGPDVGTTWLNSDLPMYSREKVSTPSSIINAVTRSCLNGIAFGNDPDVVILRDEKQNMTWEQRTLLSKANAHLGSLVFCSDVPSFYAQKQRTETHKISSTLTLQEKVSKIDFNKNRFQISFASGNVLELNLNQDPQ